MLLLVRPVGPSFQFVDLFEDVAYWRHDIDVASRRDLVWQEESDDWNNNNNSKNEK